MKKEKLIKKTLYFDGKEYEQLSKYAKEHKLKSSKIIRILIEEFNKTTREMQNKAPTSDFSIDMINYTNSSEKLLKSTLNEK